MKFVIEAAGLIVAGGKELALDLMTHLAGHAEHQFTFIVPDLAAYKAISGSNIRTIVCKKGSGLLHRARLLNHEVPRICREERADALLCLGNFVPWKRVCPTAVLLQNPWIVYRDTVAESRRTLRENLITAYGRQAYRHLRRDITIITQTPVMKDHLCRRYGIDRGRVAIIPNTLSLAKLGGNRDRAPSDRERGRKALYVSLPRSLLRAQEYRYPDRRRPETAEIHRQARQVRYHRCSRATPRRPATAGAIGSRRAGGEN